MKWFKHETDARDSEKMTALYQALSFDGVCRWWWLLETIAARMDHTGRCHAEYTVEKWCSFLKCKRKILETFLEYSQNKMGIKVERNGNILIITVPKLLEKLDNHTKNLQAKSKSLASIEVEEEVDIDKKEIKKEKKCAAILTPDRKPTQKMKEYAATQGLNGHFEECFTQWLDYHIAHNTKIYDVEASMRTWIRNAKGYTPQLFDSLAVKPICQSCKDRPYFDPKTGRKEPCKACGAHR